MTQPCTLAPATLVTVHARQSSWRTDFVRSTPLFVYLFLLHTSESLKTWPNSIPMFGFHIADEYAID